MNRIEFKQAFLRFGNNMIDTCFPCLDGMIVTKIINNTCKYIYKNKLSELDPIINLFADANGNIDGDDFVEYMKDNMIGDEGLKINLRDYVNRSSSLINIIPDKTIIITKDDLNAFLLR